MKEISEAFSSVHFSRSVKSNCLRLQESQHARLPCPSLSPRACSNSGSSSWWCHPTISSSVAALVSCCLQPFPVSRSFPTSRLFELGGHSIGASGSAFPVNIQDWFPLELTGLISLQSKGLSRVFSSTTVQKHQFFGTQPSLWHSLMLHKKCLPKKLWCTRRL